MTRLFLAAIMLVITMPLAKVPIAAFDYSEFKCLVLNAYHEARGEGPSGMEAVTQVVFNRMAIKKKTACHIIYKPQQFSWTMRKHAISAVELRDVERHLWARLVRDASVFSQYGVCDVKVILTRPESPILFATHYHTKWVKPIWRNKMKQVGVLGNHIFYKELK